MVDSIVARSILWQRPLLGGFSCKEALVKQKQFDMCRFDPVKRVVWAPYSPKIGGGRLGTIEALAMEVTKEVYTYGRADKIPRDYDSQFDLGVDRRPGLWPPENKADNPSLNNPLLRQERMGCGWLGAIFEWEGVLIEENPDLGKQAWLVLAQEEGKSPPPTFTLRRVEGMKNEQAISEVLCWSRDPNQMRRMAARKEEIYHGLQGGIYRLRSGSQEFVNVLMHYKIPMALVSTRPRKILETAIHAIGIEGYFTAIVAAEDVCRGKPDPEMYIYAAQLLQFIPDRCIVFGNSNQTMEAAHDARMKCVAIAGKQPVYELGAADLIVRQLDELSVVDLKNLADIDSSEFGSTEPQWEMEVEEDPYPSPSPSQSTTYDDDFW